MRSECIFRLILLSTWRRESPFPATASPFICVSLSCRDTDSHLLSLLAGDGDLVAQSEDRRGRRRLGSVYHDRHPPVDGLRDGRIVGDLHGYFFFEDRFHLRGREGHGV